MKGKTSLEEDDDEVVVFARTEEEQPCSIGCLITDGQIIENVFGFLSFQNDKPASLRMTCRCFAKTIDWKWILRSCQLFFFDNCDGDNSDFHSVVEKLIIYNNIPLSTVVFEVLKNKSILHFHVGHLLWIAVKQNDIDSVQQILAFPNIWFVRDVQQNVTNWRQFLDDALIADNMEVASILMEDLRVQQQIVKCSTCETNPSCLECCLQHIWNAIPCRNNKRFCKSCVGDRICSICNTYRCTVCENTPGGGIFYYTCSTCEKIACDFAEFGGSFPKCFQKCTNYDVCHQIRCVNCIKNSETCWYECKQNHIFCDQCSPSVTNYDYGDDIKVVVGDGHPCPACYGVCSIRRCGGCRDKELNTLEESESWYKCKNYKLHFFCDNCNWEKNDDIRNYMLNKGVDLSRCPLCQGYYP